MKTTISGTLNGTIMEQKQSGTNLYKGPGQPYLQHIISLIILGYEGLGALTGGSQIFQFNLCRNL